MSIKDRQVINSVGPAVILCLALICCGTSALAASQRVIRVQPQATVPGKNVLLGDIADLEGDLDFISTAGKIVVGSAPLPGGEREFKRGQIVIRLKLHGLSLKNITLECPRKIKVKTGHIQFSAEQLEAMTREFILSRAPWGADSMRLSEFLGKSVRLPQGEVTTQFELSNHDDFLGRVPVDILFYVNGDYIKKASVTMICSVLAPVAVAARDIERHSQIGPEDVRIQNSDITYLSKSIVRTPEEVIGMRARARVREGELLKRDKFEKAPLVQRGDIVTIYVESKSFRITVPGEVLESGGQGDVVRVSNLSSANNVYGVVRASKEIEVRY